MSERTVADETLTPGALTTCWEPTGWAEPMYSVTTALRMAALRPSIPSAPLGASSPRRSLTVGIVTHHEAGPGRRSLAARALLALHSSECWPRLVCHPDLERPVRLWR